MSKQIRLSPSVIDTIQRHASAAYPYECCGALIGSAGDGGGVDVVDARQLENVTEEGPRRRFRVSAADYRQCETHARHVGADLVGFYHSHPDHPAEPSQYDLDHAWPTFAYIIVAVANGKAADMTVWFLKEDRSSFEEGNLHHAENSDSHAASPLHR
jgi:proteasome lid subunit RPN8/RPN11